MNNFPLPWPPDGRTMDCTIRTTKTNKIKMNKTFNVLDESSHQELLVVLNDNGGTDFPRLGIGEDTEGVYIVDLLVDTSNIKLKQYVVPGMRVMDVVKAGLKSNVFEEWASDDIRFRVDDDLQGEWDEFYSKVLPASDLF